MITNEDLLKEISQRELTQLSDINATGDIDQDVIDDALNDAISFIESFVVLPENPTPLLKKITVDLTIYELRRKNSSIGDSDKELKKENEAYLVKMSTGRLKTEVTSTSSASVSEESKAFAFAHMPRRRVNKRGYR
jgi:phage gp36-like protein